MLKIGMCFISIMLIAIFTELILINQKIPIANVSSNNHDFSKNSPRLDLKCKKGSVVAFLGKQEQILFDNNKNRLTCTEIIKTKVGQTTKFDIRL